MFDLTDKTALVTGATGGIGEAIARALHSRGAAVVVSGTRAERLESLAADLSEKCFVAAANLSEPDAPDALVKAATVDEGLLQERLPLTDRDEFFLSGKWQ